MAYSAARYLAPRYFPPRYFIGGGGGGEPPADPVLSVPPVAFSYRADALGVQVNHSIVSNIGGGSISPSLGTKTYLDAATGWLTATILGNDITCTVDSTGVAVGLYRATVQVLSSGAVTVLLQVTLHVRPAAGGSGTTVARIVKKKRTKANRNQGGKRGKRGKRR